jgi:hypothetical protein
MGKLHELLAVEPELKAEAQRTVSRILNLFTEGKGRLKGQVRTYQPLNEDGEAFADEITALATTVNDELGDLQAAWGAWMDAAVQKETTNTRTSADILVATEDGVEPMLLAENLPAPALLNLESKLEALRKVYAAIPTNDPTEQWDWDEQLECFISAPRTTYRTQKVMRSHTLAEATEHHPAQVQAYAEDERAGTWTTIIQSGMFTPAYKQTLLRRLDELIRAVKQARQRANAEEVVGVHVARTLFRFIHRE